MLNGRYDVKKEIGKGSEGTIFLVFDSKDDLVEM